MLNIMEIGSVRVSSSPDFLQPERQHNSELMQLRALLKTLKAWPAAGDDYLHLMPEFNRHSPPITESDNEWLPLVVQDSLKGVDIGFQYPSFFQKLLMNPRLRRIFISELERAMSQQITPA
jgi:hypothetical protein